jgi:hypothetical protein
MTRSLLVVLALSCTLVAACGKKKPAEVIAAPPPPAATPAPAPAPVPAPAAEPTAAERERAEKQAKLDYATMEDRYINDSKAQWATSAKSSSTFGDDNGKTPSDSSIAANTTGPVDGKTWTNNHQDIGFDTLELSYGKPVSATEVRAVTGDYASAISKLELRAGDGTWSTVWSGVNEDKPEKRGGRTWFVRSFAKTATQVNGVRLTFANNVASGYKTVDAVQLVGE